MLFHSPKVDKSPSFLNDIYNMQNGGVIVQNNTFICYCAVQDSENYRVAVLKDGEHGKHTNAKQKEWVWHQTWPLFAPSPGADSLYYPVSYQRSHSVFRETRGRKGGGSSVLTKPEKGDDIPENDEIDEQNPRGRAAPAPATISHKEG